MVNVNGMAEGIALRHKHTKLKFHVELCTGLKYRRRSSWGWQNLALRSVQRGPRYHHGAGTPMVGHGDVVVVRIQGILWPAKHRPNSLSVISSCEEICVVANGHRKMVFNLI